MLARRAAYALGLGVGVVVILMAAIAATDQPSDLDVQVDHLRDVARTKTAEHMPMWTPAETEYWADTVERAVRTVADEPLSQPRLACIESMIDTNCRGAYARPAPEQLAFERVVFAWLVERAMARPLPDADDLALLERQVAGLATVLGRELGPQYGLDEAAVNAAVEEAMDSRAAPLIEEPLYPFDRTPLTDEGLAAFEASMRGYSADRTKKLDRRLHRSKLMGSVDGPAYMRQAMVRHLGGAAVAGIKAHCGWENSPYTGSEMARAAGDAQRRATEEYVSSTDVGPLRLMIDGGMAVAASGRARPIGTH